MIDDRVTNDNKFIGTLLEMVFDEETLAISSATGGPPKSSSVLDFGREKLDEERIVFVKGNQSTP
jgi:hypothetical protein